MSAVSETIVREFFELHGFLVRQQRKHVASGRPDEEDIDFFVLNPHPAPVPAPASAAPSRAGAAPDGFVLGSEALLRLERAIVVVKGWHTDTFSSALLASKPELFRFVGPAALRRAAECFGGRPFTKLLIVPALPAGDDARRRSIDLLRSKGVDGLVLFRTLLADLIASTEPNRNYQKSDLLQVIRVLKHYAFLREPQLELFKPGGRRASRPTGAG